MKKAGLLTLLAALVLAPGAAHAQAVITNGFGVALGINPEGHLNTPDPAGMIVPYNTGSPVGVAYFTDYGFGPAWGDATAPGCLCEGFGVSADAGAGPISGYANISSDGGVVNLAPGVMSGVTGSTATTTTSVGGLPLSVVHDYHPSASPALFEATVTLTNTSMTDTLTDVRYRRVMDWDVPPTTFDEYVTIGGTAAATNVLYASNDGFCSANPLGPLCSLGLTGDFVDGYPPASTTVDHGALFDFGFGTLLPGESRTFWIYYGAAPTEAAAYTALGVVDAEVFSFGQQSGDPLGGTPATFIFGFRGVGGTPVVPEPGTMALVGLGLAGLAAFRRRS